jgi:hypothetical protein
MFRWTTLKGLIAIILFLVIAIILEYAVVLYALSLGVQDYLLQWSFTFPGTNWTSTMAISPLFHLVPIAVIISLVSSWTYLTRQMARQPSKLLTERAAASKKKEKGVASEISHGIRRFFRRIKTGLSKAKGVAYVWNKIHFARATLKSALTVFLVFAVLVLIFSLLAYPRLIYETVSNAYQGNPSLLGFIKSTGSGIGNVLGFINNGLISAAPSFKDFALSFGAIIKPIADLDNAGKYLTFQNAAAWISAFFAIFYPEYSRRSYRRKRIRKG